VWAGGKYLIGAPLPYLTGLLAAVVGYVAVALKPATWPASWPAYWR
jgi:hypothetical protein